MCLGSTCEVDSNCFGSADGTNCQMTETGMACSNEPKPVPVPSPDHGPDTLLWLWIILGIVGVVAVGWLIYYLIQRFRSEGSETAVFY